MSLPLPLLPAFVQARVTTPFHDGSVRVADSDYVTPVHPSLAQWIFPPGWSRQLEFRCASSQHTTRSGSNPLPLRRSTPNRPHRRSPLPTLEVASKSEAGKGDHTDRRRLRPAGQAGTRTAQTTVAPGSGRRLRSRSTMMLKLVKSKHALLVNDQLSDIIIKYLPGHLLRWD